MKTALGDVTAITLFVSDPVRSKRFYQDVFGQRLVHEDANSAAFRFENTIINLLSHQAAHGLIAPAAVVERDAGSRVQLTIEVADVDAVCRELAEHGVTLLNGPMNRPWGVRTASFKDPDGHIWEIGANLPSESARQPA